MQLVQQFGIGNLLGLSFPIIDSREVMKKRRLIVLLQTLRPSTQKKIFTYFLAMRILSLSSSLCFQSKRYKSVIEVFCQQATSYDTRINGAMSATKDELRRLFFAINSRETIDKDPAMEEIGGPAGLERMMKNEFGLLDTPASPNTWNYNLPLGWGKSVKGLGFEAVAKATGVAIMKILKRQAEKSDPNISIAYKLAMVSKLANLNISTSAWSFMLLPVNVFPPPLGLGPPWSSRLHLSCDGARAVAEHGWCWRRRCRKNQRVLGGGGLRSRWKLSIKRFRWCIWL